MRNFSRHLTLLFSAVLMNSDMKSYGKVRYMLAIVCILLFICPIGCRFVYGKGCRL
jgi:hypothetical protein